MTWVNTTGYEDTLFRLRKKKGEVKIVDAPDPAIEAPIADAHTHLGQGDAPLVLARAAAHGVDFICTIATATDDLDVVYASLDTWRADAKEVLARIAPEVPDVPRVRIAAGCHPHDARKFTPEVKARLYEVLRDPGPAPSAK